MGIRIVRAVTYDVRFPTSRSGAGSDAMNPDPDYSAAYVELHTDDPALKGCGMTFTIVDPTYPMDKTCVGDRMGGTDLPLVFPGYALEFRIASGFLPYLLSLTDTVYPINVVRGPLESIWVTDEGDFLSAVSASTRGAVFRVESTAPAIVNTLE